MLINGNFEGGYRPEWDESTQTKPIHKGWVYEVEYTGSQPIKRYTVERGELHNPEGWWSWYAHQRNNNQVPWDKDNTLGWCEPETRYTETVHKRHKEGTKAFCLFTYQRIHEGGLFQQVTVNQGDKLRFTAWAHGWISNDDSQPATCSLPGCGGLTYTDDTNLTDDQRSVAYQLGIDPTGNIDPYADTVVWSKSYRIFNAYIEQLAVEATATNNVVTVFLKSSTLWPVIHNDSYFDECKLEVVEKIDPGLPRIDYKRTVNVLDAEFVSTEEREQIVKSVWPETVSPSFDDAGIGKLSDKTAVLWNIPNEKQKDYVDFFVQYYPGTRIVFKSNRTDNTKLTYPTTHLPPVITQRFNKDTGHLGLDLRSSWNVYKDKLLACIDGVIETVAYHAQLGNYVVIKGTFNGKNCQCLYAHMIVDGVYVKQGDTVKRGDVIGLPDNTGVSSGDHLHFSVRLNGVYVDPEPLIDFPSDPEEPDPGITFPWTMKKKVGLHNQGGMLDEYKYFLQKVKPSVFKTFDTGQIAEIWQHSPKTTIVYRRHVDDDRDYMFNLGAQAFVDTFKNAIMQFKDYPQVKNGQLIVESINETMAGEDIKPAVNFDVDFVNVMKRELPFARPGVATIPVGNPEKNQLDWLLPLIKVTADNWAVWCYHNYYPAWQGTSHLESDWNWYAGRWEWIHDYALSKGYNLLWMFGETGAIARESSGHMPPAEGWKHVDCLQDDWNKYKHDLLTLASRLFNHKYANRIVGATIFTVGFIGWEHFQLSNEQVRDLANSL